MKKFLVILMALCVMVSLFCVPAFAAESADELPAPAADVLLRITAIKGDGIELVGDHTNFEDGWNAAMVLAGSSREMKNKGYDRVVVDIYANWNPSAGGNIEIPENARVTLNINGYTLHRKRRQNGVDHG